MLTRKQHELLIFIYQRMRETGVPPSFDEMKEALDLRSKSGIHRLIIALEERGFLRRMANRARAIEVVRLPQSVMPNVANARAKNFQPTVIEGTLGKKTNDAPLNADNEATAPLATIAVPMMGRIAAGTPISAIQNHTHTIPVPTDMLANGEHFALEVRGDSMIEAGILDGDIVIIKKAQSAESGDIVVALIDKEEATLKRLRKKGGSLALEAANREYETRIFGPDRIQIQGKLIGLMRSY